MTAVNSSMLRTTVVPSFVLPSRVLLYKNTIFCLSICLSMAFGLFSVGGDYEAGGPEPGWFCHLFFRVQRTQLPPWHRGSCEQGHRLCVWTVHGGCLGRGASRAETSLNVSHCAQQHEAAVPGAPVSSHRDVLGAGRWAGLRSDDPTEVPQCYCGGFL